jgi:hypothetical protein
MTIPASARVNIPVQLPSPRMDFVDTQTGFLSVNGLGILTDIINYINGTSRVIPCEETGTNVLALTMQSVSPLINKYNDYDVYQFVAAATSTGLVTANVTVVQGQVTQGTLATLKVFKTNGSTQATVGDVVLGSFYLLIHVDSLDSGVGGFVLK